MVVAAWWRPVTYATLVTRGGICKASHARTGRGYHKYIEFILNSASSGVHIIALRKSTYVSNKKKQSARRQGFPIPLPPPLICTLYSGRKSARNPNKCPLHICLWTDNPFSESWPNLSWSWSWFLQNEKESSYSRHCLIVPAVLRYICTGFGTNRL